MLVFRRKTQGQQGVTPKAASKGGDWRREGTTAVLPGIRGMEVSHLAAGIHTARKGPQKKSQEAQSLSWRV